jgi:hypothetical protein
VHRLPEHRPRQAGAGRSRDGYTTFASIATERLYQITRFYTTGGLTQMLVSGRITAGHTHKVWAYDETATQLASQTVASSASFVRVGTPTAESIYCLPAGSTTWQRWNGSTFTAVTGMPSAWYGAVQSTDNRLVVGRTSNASRVQFSDPGAPETFGANNYVDLEPGDGEPITGVASWRELVFVFKQTKFFVFHGNSTGPTGDPVFNYRPERVTGAYGASFLIESCVAGKEGVYFFDGRSIWLTTGSDPVRISDAIDPYLQGRSLPFLTSASDIDPTLFFDSLNLSYAVDRLWLSVMTEAGEYAAFVYDPRYGEWMLWDLPLTNATQVRLSSNIEEFVFISTVDGAIYRFGPAYTDDAGTAITSRYRSGLYDLSVPDAEKDIKETRLYGTGTPTFKMSKNFGSLGTGQVVTLGTSPAIDSGMATNNPTPATLFSYELSGNSPWSVQRLAHHVRGQRPTDAHSG